MKEMEARKADYIGGDCSRERETATGGENGREEMAEETERAARGRIVTRKRILLLARGVGLLVLAFLFSRCRWFLSAEPFGIALLCAAEGGLGWIYGGLLLSAMPILGGSFRPISIVVVTAVVLLRVAARMTLDLPWKRGEEPTVHSFGAFSSTLFREHIALRMAIGSIAAFLTGLYRMIGGGYRVYDLLSSIFLMVTVPLVICLLAGLWKEDVARLDRLSRLASVYGLFGVLVLAFGGLSFYGISLSVFTALGATLWITHRRGISCGILLGLLLGLLIDPVSAPLYAFAALLSGALKRVSVFMGALSALSGGMAWGFYVYGLTALSVLFPALLSASLLFCVLLRLNLLPGGEAVEENKRVQEENENVLPREGESGTEKGDRTACDEVRDLWMDLRSALAEERLALLQQMQKGDKGGD